VIDREWRSKRKKQSMSLAEYTAIRQEMPPLPEKMKKFIEQEKQSYPSDRIEPHEEKVAEEEVEKEVVEPSVLDEIKTDLDTRAHSSFDSDCSHKFVCFLRQQFF
jgi:hypothetical protein